MAELDIKIRHISELFGQDQAEMLGDLAINEGWGVFRNEQGLANMPSSELLGVRRKEDVAKAEAEALNAVEGVLEFETPGDPESNVYREVTFNTSPVVRTAVKPEIVIHAQYERVAE